MPTDELLIYLILYCLIPLWLLAGFGDWLCHRYFEMSKTAGAKESIIHLLMLFEIGVPMLAGLLLEINALVLAIMMIGAIAHEITGLWDLRYAHSKRDIQPIEQHIHSFQEVLPPIILALVILLHWDQFTALISLAEEADYALEWKRHPLPSAYVFAILVLAVLFEVLPFIEEFWRSYRENNGQLVPISQDPKEPMAERQAGRYS